MMTKEHITNRGWLQNEKNLLGKTLCIIDRGFCGISKETHKRTIRFSVTHYIIDITKVEKEDMKAVDWIYGKKSIYVEYMPPMEKDDTPTFGETDCVCIDYFNPGRFEQCEYYIMSREDAIAEIKEYNRMIVGDLYNIE